MPLPCSPVSNSTASEASELLTSEDSDGSLTTPRPGPADESHRTANSLSRPSLPPASSLSSNRTRDGASWLPAAQTISGERECKVAGPRSDQLSISPSNKASEGDASTESQERKRSVTWLPQTAPSRSSKENSYVATSIMASSASPSRSPHSILRNRMSRDADEIAADSSADENTAIMRKSSFSNKLNYGAANGNGSAAEEEESMRSGRQNESLQRKKSGSLQSKRTNHNSSQPVRGQDQEQRDAEGEHETWFKSLIEKYGSVELENKGSVARDHLALERTFLAWLRTSLSFASIGIAVTQLFRLNTTIASSHPDTGTTFAATNKLRSIGKPLGATFLGISILILLLGFHRYFESQHYVIRGKFPASRGTIVLVSAVTTALIVTSLVVVVAVAPQAFEKR